MRWIAMVMVAAVLGGCSIFQPANEVSPPSAVGKVTTVQSHGGRTITYTPAAKRDAEAQALPAPVVVVEQPDTVTHEETFDARGAGLISTDAASVGGFKTSVPEVHQGDSGSQGGGQTGLDWKAVKSGSAWGLIGIGVFICAAGIGMFFFGVPAKIAGAVAAMGGSVIGLAVLAQVFVENGLILLIAAGAAAIGGIVLWASHGKWATKFKQEINDTVKSDLQAGGHFDAAGAIHLIQTGNVDEAKTIAAGPPMPDTGTVTQNIADATRVAPPAG